MPWPDRAIPTGSRSGVRLAHWIQPLGSEGDEPGCLRFNVLQDEKDPNVYYFFEVYKDQAALEQHRAAPHYAVWRAAADSLDGPTEPTRCVTVFPKERPYWGKV